MSPEFAGVAVTAGSVGDRSEPEPRVVSVPETFSLHDTCAPVAWADGRWPQWSWRDGRFLWAGWSGADGTLPVWREARLVRPGEIHVIGDAPGVDDVAWARAVMGIDQICPAFTDPVVEAIRERRSGLRPFAAGSLFDGLVMSIVGQSITVKAAAVVLRRVAAIFSTPIGPDNASLIPLPRPDHLANADRATLRATGLTWRRADALIAVGRSFSDDPVHWTDPELSLDDLTVRLRSLPLVGPWTANAALLWGIAAPDVHVSGDVALLRAARAAYGQPSWRMRDLDLQAESWRPSRAWAARLLWCDLFGVPLDAVSGGS